MIVDLSEKEIEFLIHVIHFYTASKLAEVAALKEELEALTLTRRLEAN